MDNKSGTGRPLGNFPLARQGSIYSLTFDELQNTMGSIGKDFGSMNMDELLKNIWNAEEMQTMGYNTATTGPDRAGAGSGGVNLQRQGSLTLPRTLSQKTVDEVWKDLSKEYNNGFGQPDLPQRQQTLGEMTLEDFLVKAGVVREETQLANKPNDTVLFSNLTNSQNNPAFGAIGFQQNTAVNDNGSNQITFQSTNLPLINNGFRSTQKQPQQLFPKQGNLGYGGPNQLGSPVMNSVNLVTSDGGDISPAPYAFNGVLRGRRSGPIEKVVERRQKRMIKNRESAARSRARKQAYTTELEAEVSELKKRNEELKRKQEEMLETQKTQVMQPGVKRHCLEKTLSGPW